MKWHDTHALVTGGTRGIGLQLVKQLLDKGAHVTATGTTEQSLSEARLQWPQVNWQVLDQANAASRQALVDSLPAHGVQLVIHNAGVQQMRDWSVPEAPVMATINLRGACDMMLYPILVVIHRACAL
jgi:uncharacterized oxidoreductase